MWKSEFLVLQDCYKERLTALCTDERRGRKCFQLSAITLWQIKRDPVRVVWCHFADGFALTDSNREFTPFALMFWRSIE